MKNLPAIVTLIALAAAVPLAARRTTRPNLRPEPAEQGSEGADSLAVPIFECVTPSEWPEVSFAGYDKPLQSRRESFFATNGDSARTVERIWLTATYYDMAGRMLHRRTIAVDGPVPPGQTRQLTVPSWDTQRSFYYHLSTPPTRTPGTPYRVTLAPDSMIVSQ